MEYISTAIDKNIKAILDRCQDCLKEIKNEDTKTQIEYLTLLTAIIKDITRIHKGETQ